MKKRELKRIFILGTVGSGKSYLGRKISALVSARHYDLDDIYWEKKFTNRRKPLERNQILSRAIKDKKWIIGGVYTSWTSEAIKKADLVVLLDTPLPVIYLRLLGRFIFDRKTCSWRELKKLVRYARVYKKRNGSPYNFSASLRAAEKNKSEPLILRSKKEVRRFLRELK